MKREEIIKKYGKLTKAQKLATRFYEKCNVPNKTIEYEIATASVYISAFTAEEILLLKEIGAKLYNWIIYPADEKVEIWFVDKD